MILIAAFLLPLGSESPLFRVLDPKSVNGLMAAIDAVIILNVIQKILFLICNCIYDYV